VYLRSIPKARIFERNFEVYLRVKSGSNTRKHYTGINQAIIPGSVSKDPISDEIQALKLLHANYLL
jgi:hypothetical protein